MRRGLTLLEIMAVMAIVVILAAIGIPSITGLLGVQQATATRELATTYAGLRDEAGLRNVTFRIAYNLDTATYRIEVGDPSTLVFGTPEERELAERDLKDQMKRYTQRELEEGAAEELEGPRFSGLQAPGFASEVTLPGDTYIAWIWTPQYREPVVAPQEPAEDPEEHTIVYSYIFPDGQMERTFVRLLGLSDGGDPDEGFTLEVEPLSGRVLVHVGEVAPFEVDAWIPIEGPELNL